jgi:hypothetical protein
VIADRKPTMGQRGAAVPGRLRPADLQNCVLDATYEGVLRDSFRTLTVEAVSAQTGAAETVFAQVLRGSQPVNSATPSLRKQKVHR